MITVCTIIGILVLAILVVQVKKNPSHSQVICPKCDGWGTYEKEMPGHELRKMICEPCKGTGKLLQP
jgi:DnaJ-class molecular chaperone